MFKTQCGSAIDGYKGAVAVRRICNSPASPHLHHLVEEEDCRRCTRNEPPKTPPLAARIVSYAEAVARWIAAGRPTRSEEEVKTIYETHCKPCPWREWGTDICRGCGCYVTDHGLAVSNKIKMATEHCPQEGW